MLSDGSIRHAIAIGLIGVDPAPQDQAYQPASVDVRLDRSLIWLDTGLHPSGDFDGFWLMPEQCVLACTVETIRVPRHMVGRVEGKSSWGRRFLQVHATAGFVDPGFCGQITLELKNLGPDALWLPVFSYIAQISFQMLDAAAQRPYGSPGLGSHYQGQRGATPPC